VGSIMDGRESTFIKIYSRGNRIIFGSIIFRMDLNRGLSCGWEESFNFHKFL